ncbi:MAG: hypothetical protein IJ243_01285 [Prevotella sp.]|nr:hypothetical protein [Prevotella sp.]
MKRIALLFILYSLFFSPAGAQTDTLVINHPRKVTIISSDSLQRVIVSGMQGDDDFRYQNTIRLVDANYESNVNISRDHWELIPSVKVGRTKSDTASYSRYNNMITAHFGIGFTCPTSVDQRIDFSTFKSWEIFAGPFPRPARAQHGVLGPWHRLAQLSHHRRPVLYQGPRRQRHRG